MTLLEETKWRGAKSHEIVDGCKLHNEWASKKRHGMAAVIAERFRDKILLTQRVSDRLMATKIYVSK